MVAPVRTNATYAEYLELERTSEQRHIYFDGEVLERTGLTPRRAQLAANIIGALSHALASRRCAIFNSLLRVRVRSGNGTRGAASYPDAAVVCDSLEVAPDDPDAVTNPALLVEIARGHEHTSMLARYRRIPSLRAYLVVEQDARSVEVVTRNDDRSWTLREFTQGEAPIPPLECALALDEIYADPLAR